MLWRDAAVGQDRSVMIGRGTGGLAAVAGTVSHRGPWLIAILLAAFGCVAALDVWRIVTVKAPVAVSPAVGVTPAGAGLPTDVAAIVDRHFFGLAAAGGKGAAPPPTRAALVLGGVWYTPAGDVYALIGEPGVAQRSYKVGDRLPGGVELVGVEADRVLLRRDGKTETLALPRLSLNAGPAGAARPQR
jgi:general secretion pathway protein C